MQQLRSHFKSSFAGSTLSQKLVSGFGRRRMQSGVIHSLSPSFCTSMLVVLTHFAKIGSRSCYRWGSASIPFHSIHRSIEEREMPEAGSHPSVFLPSLRHFFNNGTRISASRLAAELRRGRVEKRERKEGRMWGDRSSMAGEGARHCQTRGKSSVVRRNRDLK